MGKGYNNYMCKKFFHPSSKDNQKRLWQAQKKHEGELQAQAELRAQYDKEQELYQNKSLLSKESKDKMEVNFMYEPPPGVKKISANPEDDEGEPEYKFEWQRTWGMAPKESYLGEGDNFAEQPFGIQVCQAKCIKCGAYGHMNIDKRCPLYGKAVDAEAPLPSRDSDKLIHEMRQEGMAMRWNTWDMGSSAPAGGKKMDMVDSYEKPKPLVDRAMVLKNMSKEDKKKLLKKLEKMEKKKKDKKKKRRSDDSDDESSSEDEGGVKVKKEPESRRGEKEERNRSREKKKERSRSREKKRDRSRSREKRRERSKERKRRSYSSDDGRRGKRDGSRERR